MIAPDVAPVIDLDELAAMRGAAGVIPRWLPNPWLRAGGRVLMLGCGASPMVGAVNHDMSCHSPWVDVTGNLDVMPWDGLRAITSDVFAPRENGGTPIVGRGAFDAVYAYDLFEHLKDVYGAVNECHVLLRPGGLLVFRMSAWDNPVSYRDLTHRHYAHPESMDFFDRTTSIGEHYSGFHPVDSLGRLPTHWHIDGVDRVNPDPRYKIGDLQWTMVKI